MEVQDGTKCEESRDLHSQVVPRVDRSCIKSQVSFFANEMILRRLSPGNILSVSHNPGKIRDCIE